MAMSAEHRSKFAALHRQWWHLHMSEKFSSGTENSKQANKNYACFIKTVISDVKFFKNALLFWYAVLTRILERLIE